MPKKGKSRGKVVGAGGLSRTIYFTCNPDRSIKFYSERDQNSIMAIHCVKCEVCRPLKKKLREAPWAKYVHRGRDDFDWHCTEVILSESESAGGASVGDGGKKIQPLLIFEINLHAFHYEVFQLRCNLRYHHILQVCCHGVQERTENARFVVKSLTGSLSSFTISMKYTVKCA